MKRGAFILSALLVLGAGVSLWGTGMMLVCKSG
jgi:hypothetical protein